MAPGNNLEEARKNLAKLFFQDKPNRWVNGIAIGFIPQEATDEMSPAPKAVAPTTAEGRCSAPAPENAQGGGICEPFDAQMRTG